MKLDLEALITKVRILFALVRVRNVLISLIGVFVGAVLYDPDIAIQPILMAAASAGFILAGGNILNDYFDIATDKTNKPWRPLPSGHISMSDTLMLAIVFFLLGLGLSKAVNEYCLIVAIVNTGILILYARYSKRLLLVSNLSISYLVASVFLYGALATLKPGDPVGSAGILLMVVTACSFFMTLAREIMKDIEDIEGDAKVYASSLPIKLGEKRSAIIATIFGIAAVLISLTPIFVHPPGFNTLYYGIFISLADLIFISAFTMHPALAQRMMVGGMTLSLIAFMVGRLIPPI
ncbi:geranylgeranylglycerol-phosphate geranylgeranyltransferase [Candidatus Altiarchaeota archaeon]